MSSVDQRRVVPFDPWFPGAIDFAKVALHFQVLETVRLPPYPGTTLRGSFARALHGVFCRMPDPCPAECLQPENCLYYRLFERDRLDPRCHGRNIPKALIIDPPLPGQLEQIALGAAVQPPYRLSHIGNGIPILENDHEIVLETGAVFAVQFTLFGRERTSLPALLRTLSRRNLRVGRGRFALHAAFDCTAAHNLLFDVRHQDLPAQEPSRQVLATFVNPVPDSIRRLRLCLLTPTRRRRGESICLRPESLWDGFLDGCLARATQIHDLYCAPPGFRSPYMELPPTPRQITASRLFHYSLPRLSIQQQQWMEFDGLIGYFDLEGDLGPVYPLLKAMEILHVGQKASMGLGRILCFRLS